jgi:sugar phosphate isomerase/epimerase
LARTADPDFHQWKKASTIPLEGQWIEGAFGGRTGGTAKRVMEAIGRNMQRVLSTHVIANHRLTSAWLSRVERSGIPAVEIFCARQHLDYQDKGQITELGHWFRDSDLKLHSLHAPMYTDDIWGRSGPHSHINITERVKSERIKWVDEIKRAVEIAETIPFRYLIQHLGVGGQEYSEHAIEAAFSSLEELTVFARQRGVEILLENTPNELSTAERLRLFNDMTHLRLNYVFDIGHAHFGPGIEHEFDIMKEQIRSLHLHDNNGREDQHLFPGAEGGTIDWPRAMQLLRSREDQYPLLLELREAPEHQNPLNEVVRVFETLESRQTASA